MVLQFISSCCSTLSPAARFENSHITLNYFTLHTHFSGLPCAYHCSHLLRAIPSLSPFIPVYQYCPWRIHVFIPNHHGIMKSLFCACSHTKNIFDSVTLLWDHMSVGEIMLVLIHTQSSKWPKICFPTAIRYQKQKRKALVLYTMASSNETAALEDQLASFKSAVREHFWEQVVNQLRTEGLRCLKAVYKWKHIEHVNAF